MQATQMLTESGRIAEKLPGYESRHKQQEMTQAVVEAFEAAGYVCYHLSH